MARSSSRRAVLGTDRGQGPGVQGQGTPPEPAPRLPEVWSVPPGASPCRERQDRRPRQAASWVSGAEEPRWAAEGRELGQGQVSAPHPAPPLRGLALALTLPLTFPQPCAPPPPPFLGTSQWLSHTALCVPQAPGRICCDFSCPLKSQAFVQHTRTEHELGTRPETRLDRGGRPGPPNPREHSGA